MEVYGPEYEHYQWCVARSGKLSRRVFDTLRHIIPVAGSVKKGDMVLDVGSGIGENGHDLTKLGLKTVSVDLSPYAQQTGQKVFGTEDGNHRVVGDSLNLPFAERSFDFATSLDLFEHLQPSQIIRVLDELERVTKNRKLFIKVTPTEDVKNIDKDPTHVTKWSEETWTKWFEDQGWKTLGKTTKNLLIRAVHGFFLLEKMV